MQSRAKSDSSGHLRLHSHAGSWASAFWAADSCFKEALHRCTSKEQQWDSASVSQGSNPRDGCNEVQKPAIRYNKAQQGRTAARRPESHAPSKRLIVPYCTVLRLIAPSRSAAQEIRRPLRPISEAPKCGRHKTSWKRCVLSTVQTPGEHAGTGPRPARASIRDRSLGNRVQQGARRSAAAPQT